MCVCVFNSFCFNKFRSVLLFLFFSFIFLFYPKSFCPISLLILHAIMIILHHAPYQNSQPIYHAPHRQASRHRRPSLPRYSIGSIPGSPRAIGYPPLSPPISPASIGSRGSSSSKTSPTKSPRSRRDSHVFQFGVPLTVGARYSAGSLLVFPILCSSCCSVRMPTRLCGH